MLLTLVQMQKNLSTALETFLVNFINSDIAKEQRPVCEATTLLTLLCSELAAMPAKSLGTPLLILPCFCDFPLSPTEQCCFVVKKSE